MAGNRKLRCIDRRGYLTETTESLRKLEIWLGFLFKLALLLFLGMDNSTP
ncbi:hypothetical protein QE400_000259 [Xanthomonas sacchari]|nr:hypothetical protein [Xanthomonas sacchari]MDQ1090846.1 hypothetical protein [Xanthomonas sacchari]